MCEVHRRSDRGRSVNLKFARTERRVSRAVSVSASQRNSEPRAGILETPAEGARTSGIVSAAMSLTRPPGRPDLFGASFDRFVAQAYRGTLVQTRGAPPRSRMRNTDNALPLAETRHYRRRN